MANGEATTVGVFDLQERVGRAVSELLAGGCGYADVGVVWAEGAGVGGAGGLWEVVARGGELGDGLARLGVGDVGYYAGEVAAGRYLVLSTSPSAARSAFGRHGGSVRVPADLREPAAG